MKEKFVSLCDWAQAHWLALVIFMTLAWGGMLIVVAFSWLYGYWSNGLLGTKFDLGSCWQGIGAILTGFASIAALAKAAWTKYQADSEFNTPLGEIPIKGRSTNESR